MRALTPRPILLALTLALVVGAVLFIELRLDAASPVSAEQNPDRPTVDKVTQTGPETGGTSDGAPDGRAGEATPRPSGGGKEQRASDRSESSKPEQEISDAQRVAKKEGEHQRAEEIVAPSGFVNTDDFSIKDAAGEKVVLLEFWTYTCFNCQNVQPHINAWHERYADDGLQVVGVHTPEFGFEKDYANVEAAVREAGIEYPVVLDNAYATWNAYDNRYWPAV